MNEDWKMRDDLMDCGSLMDMFRTLNKYYDLDNCKPSSMIKAMLYPQLHSAIIKTNAKQKLSASNMRPDVLSKDSIMEVLNTLNKYFDLDNLFLSPIEKQKMLGGLSKVVAITGARQRRVNV